MADANIAAIGKYHIVALVGEGAMGVVYKAVDSVLERTVAIKVMNEAIARSEELRQRFLREAQAAASIQHPNVVSVYDLGESDGHLFIAMEFVPGADLEDIIESGARLSLQAKLDIVIDVLTGLSYAHKRGIVHRDIKPANIRVAEDGRAKIMDFGVAHLASSKLTSTGASLGTPSYMAPEQITTGKVASGSDIFSVGAVLYELLALTKPFDGPTMQNLLFKIVTEEPRPISDLVPNLPPSLDRIVHRAMAKEMSDRYESALDMANELSIVRGEIGGKSYPTSVSLNARVSSAMAVQERTNYARTRKIRVRSASAAIAAVAVVAIGFGLYGHTRSNAAALDDATVESPTPSVASTAAAPAPTAPRVVPATAGITASSPAVVERTAASPVTRERTIAPPAAASGAARANVAPASSSVSTSASSPAAASATSTPAPAPATSATPAPPPTQQVVQQQIAPPRTPALAAASPQPVPDNPPAPAMPTAADITPVFDAYAKAIESRDVSAIRHVYPGLTAEQERGFQQFFQSARKIDVTFHVAGVDGTRNSADARVSGTYMYESSSGKTERQPVNFAATLRRDGSEWRLVSLR